MSEIKHTEAFDLAYRFITETNLNIFLTGKAGTGKTTFLKYLRENCFKKMVVAAPTGVAAINAGGVTLHSLFQLPFGPVIPNSSPSLLSKIHYHGEKLNLLRNLELLVIDEASMVACHTVDAIDTILKSISRRHSEPFGGVQVLFIGDLHQLQPVVKNEEWQFLKEYYPSIFFFDSIALGENAPVMIELKEIFRQKDSSFVDVLNDVRNNSLTRENFDLLNTRLQRNYNGHGEDGYITLTTHNVQSDKINKGKLQRLNSTSRIFNAEISGDFPDHIFPAEVNLELKVGSQVMFLKNDVEGKKYFNGKLGVITKLSDFEIRVKCKDEDFEIIVGKQEWKNISYKLNHDTRQITEEELGSFSQYPLRLAWAITIHKSQGLTFDKVVIDAENAFANGQVYVALSRCTSLEGLILTSPINQKFLGAHENLTEWQKKNYDENSLPQRFNESRQKYVQQELQSIFTWKNWSFELWELKKIIDELKDELPNECPEWITGLISKQKELEKVAEKFKDRIILLCNENPVVEDNAALQQRIKDAANYFSSEITKWKDHFSNHSLATDTKKNSKKIDASLDEINVIVHEILHKINQCKNGFTLNDYLKNGKKLSGEIPKIQSSYEQNQNRKTTTNESSHSDLYDRLAEMRKRIADEQNVPLYLVFNNSAIKNVCESLPVSTAALLKVGGFGKAKVGQFGDEVIEIVKDYCEENNLEPQQSIKTSKKKDKDKKSPTLDETLALYKLGKSIEDVAKERTLAVSTIEGHLAQAIGKQLIKIDDVMTLEEANKIAKYFQGGSASYSLNAIKEKAPGVSFGKLRMVLAWIQLKKEAGS